MSSWEAKHQGKRVGQGLPIRWRSRAGLELHRREWATCTTAMCLNRDSSADGCVKSRAKVAIAGGGAFFKVQSAEVPAADANKLLSPARARHHQPCNWVAFGSFKTNCYRWLGHDIINRVIGWRSGALECQGRDCKRPDACAKALNP